MFNSFYTISNSSLRIGGPLLFCVIFSSYMLNYIVSVLSFHTDFQYILFRLSLSDLSVIILP